MEDAAAQAVIEKLLSLMMSLKFNQVQDFVDDMEKLKGSFMWIQATLHDAGMQHITSKVVKLWLTNLQDVSREAYNALDEFYYHLLHMKAQNTVMKKLKSIFSGSYSNDPRKLGRKIKAINEKLDSLINREARFIGIHQMLLGRQNDTPGVGAGASASSETDSYSLDPLFIGRRDDVYEIVDMVASYTTEGKVPILPVVGMRGLGKTTLAREVYHHNWILNYFDIRIWVHVSTTFDSTHLLKKILTTLTLEKVEVEIREVVLRKLEIELENRSVFLVLDDVWNQDQQMWEDLINPLSRFLSTGRSFIIVTTRNSEVGSVVGTLPIYKLNGLSEECCWSIIKKKAFGEREIPSEFQIIGKIIAKRCQGLPLAANLVGRRLCGKSKDEWVSIEQNWWLSEVDGDGDNISTILKLSLQHLPSPSHWGSKLLREEATRVLEDGEERSAAKGECDILEDGERDMHRNMPPSVNYFKSLKTVESESSGEIQVVYERITQTGAENLQTEQRDITAESVLKGRHYLVSEEDLIDLKMDHQTILTEDIRSSKQPESSPVNPVLNLIEQNLYIEQRDITTESVLKERHYMVSEERSAGSDILEDSETGRSRNMPTSVSDLISLQTVESGSYGEIQVVDEGTTLTGAENLYIQQRDITAESVLKERHYMVSVKEDHIELKLDHQTILIEDIRSSTQPESSPVLNLIEQSIRELPEKSDYCDSLALFVQRNYQLTLIHPSFFDSMPNLRFLDLSDTRIRILPSSLYRLPKLKVLMLSNCAGLENLPSDIGNLNQVEVLDISGTTEVYSLPDETGQLVLLRDMKVSFYGPDDESEFDHLPSQLVSPSVFTELKELRALSITVHPEDHRWTDIASRILEEVGKLEMLSYLQFYFPKVEIFEDYIQMNQHKLNKFNFIVGHNVKRIVSRVPDEVESLFDQQDKCLRLVNGDKVTQLIKTALIQVTAFYLDHHTEIQSLSEFGISNFKALKFCVVRECPEIQAIMNEKADEGAFPCLEHLGVYYLWELKHIWKPPSPPGRLKRILKTPVPCGHFKALKCLVVITCPKLQFILWGSMLQCLSNLEELVVKDCEKVEKIINEEKKKVKYDDVILPGLRKLVLHYLPDLVSLGNGLRPSIEKVDVHGCPKLKPLPQ